jgi:hippurate hydrolase
MRRQIHGPARLLALAAVFGLTSAALAQNKGLEGAPLKQRTEEIKKKIDSEFDSLQALYKQLHSNPELSLQEVATAARLAKELKALGFEVTEKVGGTGVVGVFKNGKGPTILVRTDMDALPVVEETGVAYASKVKTRDKQGNEVGVMHACGHDMHMACWVGTARVLTSLKDRWQGTLVFVGQPAEEIGAGGRMMLEDGLYKRFPKPDYCLALHCDSRYPHGQISYTDGLALANVDTMDILVKGKGGHGSAPHTTIDPVVLAARIVLDLQTIVSRERDPLDPAVVTVGSIHGGTKHNIIPNDVKLQLTIRTTKDSTRKNVLDAIVRIAKAAAAGARAPEPVITHHPGEFTPALINDSALTRRTASVLKEALGAANVVERPPILGGEDFSRYALSGDDKVPIFLFFLGTMPPERVAEAAKPGGALLPSLHSAEYYPVLEPSLRTGVLSMSLSVLNLMGK